MLVGRQAEITHIVDLLRKDRPVVVLGEPGIGKSALLRAATGHLGWRTREGGALSTLSWMPFFPLARAIDARRLDGDATAVAQRIRALLGEESVLVVDDLHWADPGTLDVLELLAGTVPIATAARTGEPGSVALVERLMAAGFADMRLNALSDDDSEAVVNAHRPDLSQTALRRLVRRCGGVPLLLIQMVAGGGEISESLRLSLASRLRHLPDSTARLFGLISLAGRPLTVDPGWEDDLSLLESVELVRRHDDEVEVCHAVLAEHAVERLDGASRMALHRELAARASTLGEAARHHEAAGDHDLAREAALAAADEAVDLPVELAAHLALAARCSDEAGADRLRVRAAWALVLALQSAEAEQILEDVTGTEPAIRAEVAMVRSRTRWIFADKDGFRRELAEAVEAGIAADPATLARARVEAARRWIFLDRDQVDAAAVAAEALAATHAAGVPSARARMILGLAHYVSDDPRWRESFQRALDEARDVGDIDSEVMIANNLITAHESSGEPKVGRIIATAMIERTGQLGLAGWQLRFRAWRVHLDAHAADYHRAVAEAVELFDEPLDPSARDQNEVALAMCLVELGQLERVERRLRDIENGPLRDVVGIPALRWLQSEMHLYGGRPEDALRTASESHHGDANDILPQLVMRWAALESGEDPQEPIDPQPMPFMRGSHPESMGILALSDGRHDEAAGHFDEAVVLWEPYHRRAALRCGWAAAEALRRLGQEDEARRRLLVLEAELARREMRPLLGRVHRSLRQLGVRRSAPRGRRPGSSLTSRETEVVQLVAAGLSNAEIGRRLGISRSAVTASLGSAMTSLGATSRGQVAAAVLTG